MTTPAERGFAMPAEWLPHERTWMAWPCPNPTFDDPADLADSRAAWATVARTIRRFEPVTVVWRLHPTSGLRRSGLARSTGCMS